MTRERTKYHPELGDNTGEKNARSLESIMTFLRQEVHSEKMVVSSRTGFAANQATRKKEYAPAPQNETNGDQATAAALTNIQKSKWICETKLIIWDGEPMTHVHAFIAVHRLLQDLTNCSLPFGGNVILLGGDFRHVLPVVWKGSRSLTVASCLKTHNLWSKFIKLNLVKNMRVLKIEKEFSNWLLEVSEGKSGDTVMLPDVCYPTEQSPFKQLYGDLNFSTVMPQELTDRAILTVTNDACILINIRY
ncbi:hypothetical protein HNY73_014532 [Argiope bruennichi]|uniref:ATP-dependent DNA helicase n=1 Tax=Argiope bruennichi TaxID=94029 RepID=A0A8T0EPQ7_ARGBR|nr:hypothetical protein HNY73_014532 [Argiope bruennichi]